MWYKVSKIILADIQGAIAKLKESGISQDVIDFINSFSDDQTKGRLIGALNRNPSLTIDDLRTQILEKRQYQPTEQEKFSVSTYFFTEEFKRWMLFVLKNKRASTQDNGKTFNYSFGDLSDFIRESNHLEDFYMAFKRDNPSYQLGNKTWEEVKEDSDEWHEAISNRGSGKFYQPYERDEQGNLDDDRIMKIYPDGYKMVRVESSNDLDVEGHLMHHCVGSYASRVRGGNSIIYSLRDQNNHPKVTIEVNRDGVVQQVQGPSNSEVEDENLIEKIKEFFEDEESIDKNNNGERVRNYYENEYEVTWNSYPEEIKYALTESIYGPYISEEEFENTGGDFTKFGITNSFDEDDFKDSWFRNSDIKDITTTAIETIRDGIKRGRKFNNIFDEYANILLEAAIEKIKSEINLNARRSTEELYFYLIRNNDLLDLLDRFLERYDEYLADYGNVQIREIDPKMIINQMLENEDGLLVYFAKNYKKAIEESDLNKVFQENFDENFDIERNTKRKLEALEPYLDPKDPYPAQLRLFIPREDLEIGKDVIDKRTKAKIQTDPNDTYRPINWLYAKKYNHRQFRRG
jgi:hypothetical protein